MNGTDAFAIISKEPVIEAVDGGDFVVELTAAVELATTVSQDGSIRIFSMPRGLFEHEASLLWLVADRIYADGEEFEEDNAKLIEALEAAIDLCKNHDEEKLARILEKREEM